MMLLGLILAVSCAGVTAAGCLLCHRGAVAAPAVDARHPLRSARGLFASKWWTIGWLAAIVAWLLHMGALTLVPLSLVQAVISGGLVFLAVLAERFFGFELRRRQWIGLLATALGLAVIAITTGPSGQGAPSVPAVIVVEATVFAASLLVVIATVKRSGPLAENGLALGLAAGALFGVCDVAMKFVTHALAGGVLAGVVSPWPLVAVAASVIAFYVSARSLQIGPALGVIAFASVAANLVAISGGILVFHDSMGAGSAQIAARMLAFCLVIFGSALIPGPVRAHTTGDPGRYGLLRPAPSPHGAA